MKYVQHTNDSSLIKNILERENSYNSMAYDGSPPLSEYIPKGVWLLLLEGEAIAGMINFEQMNNVMWQPHIFIFEQHRRNHSERWGKKAAEFMRDNLNARKFLVLTPHGPAKKYAERVGFSCVGVLKNSILKNRKLMNQYVLEMETAR